jgi:hypothetical protein
MQLTRANIFERVRSQRLTPERLRRLPQRLDRATIQYDVTLGIPTNKRTPAEDVKGRGPAMRVYWRSVSGFDPSIEHSNRVVLK